LPAFSSPRGATFSGVEHFGAMRVFCACLTQRFSPPIGVRRTPEFAS